MDAGQLQKWHQQLRACTGDWESSEVGMVHAATHSRAMQEDTGSKLGGGPSGEVEADETFVGGKARTCTRTANCAITGLATKDKTIVQGTLTAAGSRAKVVPNVKRETLQNEVLANVKRRAFTPMRCCLRTDSLSICA